jgi:taurine dioxygenase
MHTTKLDAPLGARLHLDSDSPLDQRERDQFIRAFAEHGLLVIREGELSDERQIELLSSLGRIEPDETGQPMRMEVTNQHDQTSAPDGELVFHYDYAYDPAPIPGISMYGSLVAEGATPTCFANSSSVLSRLPKPLVERLRTLQAAHACFLYRLDHPEERNEEPDPILSRGEIGWGPEHYWTHHPAILKNGFGVESLFLCLQHTDRLIGLPRTASDGILEEVYGHLYDREHIYTHPWQPDDLVIWDNLTVQHARPDPNDLPRTLRRYHLSETNLTEDYLRVAREQGLV